MFRPLRASVASACLLFLGAALAETAPDHGVAALQATYARVVTPGEQAEGFRDLFTNLLQRIQRSYATEIDLPSLTAAALDAIDSLPAGTGEPVQVFSKAMNAALATLDPYSRYLDPRSQSNERSDSSGRFGGLGLEVEASQGAVRVVAPIADSPAARAGMQAGDLILRVDDQPLAGVPLADAIARMRGLPGTQVSLTIRRAGLPNEITVALTRDTIRRQMLRSSMEGDVLVLKVGSFSGPVTAAVQQAIKEATATATPRGVILDLRGNPGGLLREAVTTADIFLKEGEIVSLRGRTPSNQRSWRADETELLAGVPMVVMIDRRSASAAELVAAALQDNGRATVFGERSFGKGTVQSTFSLPEEGKGALKLTTAYYHGPSGRSVQKTGVAPDVEITSAAAPRGARGEDATTPAAAAPPMSKAQVEQGRCSSAYKSPDAALSCAIGYLATADMAAFLSRVGGAQP